MSALRDPVRLIPFLFAGFIIVGTILLAMPFSSASGEWTSLVTAFFTSTSAVAVTGLIIEDTPVYWSMFGQITIMVLFQIGGFGIMTAATLLGLVAGRQFGLRDKMATQVERSRLDIGDAGSVLKLVLKITVVVESVLATILAIRFATVHDYAWEAAIWHGIFHAISAFNNAGFSTFSDSLMGFQTDPVIQVPVMLTIILTALGYPVMQELRARPLQFAKWTLHTKITVSATIVLLLVGFFATLGMEWDNPDTLGPMSTGAKVLNSWFHSITPRTTGFNTLDMGAMRDQTIVLNYILMFIGGGSAGTAGGIKITTFVVLLIIVWSEIRRQRDAVVFGRRIERGVERQALSIATLGATLIMLATMYLLSITGLPLRDVLFEAISAFSTVGLSTGITADLPPSGHIALCVLMFVGRVGTITVATALALGAAQHKPYRYPEEAPIVG
ncbi:TrkH family potassium uptake protein [Aurantiacibacter gangjinensis]|uniref:ATPase n=1 Tax=Aurantiacibacter gangjinensis TaxID=502682 RepID=A0A0G9MMQ1_9SPHN|nr:potassium transporter TrkG [Aurantiacibacter gangjinensis]APE28043.1 Potassium uptake protein TrkH [Aurantiacibacter gangjinensis]KLE31970.1 ATPase [Aurantiacibacter gangjinensis]